MATVCVFCASSSTIDDRYVRLAAEVGQLLAQHDHGLVTGGGSVSMMGAVARATRAAGGHTVGVIPQALIDMEVADHDADELIVATDMRTRKAEMDRRSDAFITLPGGIGTLDELTEVWTAFTLGMHAKPVLVVDPWGDYTHFRAQIEHLVKSNFMRPAAAAAIHWTTSAHQAVDLLNTLLATTEGPVTMQVDEALEP